jgi:S-adenosylmethionine uptake transporter
MADVDSLPEEPRFRDQLLGVVLLSLGLLIFSFQDVIVRLLSGDYPVHQLVFLRGIMAIWLIAGYTYWRFGRAGFRIERPILVFVRGLMGVSSYTLYYMALTSLTLADLVTINFSSPIFIAALAVPVLGEKLGWRRWAAILVGFAGVIVVVGPSGNILNPAALFAVGAAVTYAGMTLITRMLGGSMTGGGIAFYMMMVFVVVSGLSGVLLGDGALLHEQAHPSIAFLLRPWTIPTPEDVGLIAITALIAAAGFILMVTAYATTQTSVVAPFEYTGVLWGVAAGWIFFGEVPGVWTYVGTALIVGSGLYILYREAARGRPPRPLRNPALDFDGPIDRGVAPPEDTSKSPIPWAPR